MNICLLGNNLTNLVLANTLLSKKINVDLITNTSSSVPKDTVRTIAISNENYKFLEEHIKGFTNLGWPTKKIKIFSSKKNSEELFEFKNNNKNNFYLVRYIEFYNLLKKNRLLKFLRIKNYNFQTIKKRKYDLIINSEKNNQITKKFFPKKIEKNYKSIAHTAIINHKKTDNQTAVQIFTSNGPLAFLPLSSNKTSIVFSNNSTESIDKKKLLNIINQYSHKYIINYISKVESFNISFSFLRNYVFENILSFGDLIHKVHPLAGQGFNMTIRDIRSLSNIIDANVKLGINDGAIIAQKFQETNKHLNFIYGLGIDSINSFFNIDNKFKNKISLPIFKILKGNKFLNSYSTLLSD